MGSHKERKIGVRARFNYKTITVPNLNCHRFIERIVGDLRKTGVSIPVNSQLCSNPTLEA
jgi:hypothetical protein